MNSTEQLTIRNISSQTSLAVLIANPDAKIALPTKPFSINHPTEIRNLKTSAKTKRLNRSIPKLTTNLLLLRLARRSQRNTSRTGPASTPTPIKHSLGTQLHRRITNAAKSTPAGRSALSTTTSARARAFVYPESSADQLTRA